MGRILTLLFLVFATLATATPLPKLPASIDKPAHIKARFSKKINWKEDDIIVCPYMADKKLMSCMSFDEFNEMMKSRASRTQIKSYGY